MLERLFHLKENNTDVRTEIVAGITTFMTMAYIIIVNPLILSAAGMDRGAVMVATILSSAATTLFMGLYANYPFALAPGMGLNAFFVVAAEVMGLGWQVALAAVFINGVIFFLLSVTRLREYIINSIPATIKLATSVGIGLFIALIGFELGGIVVDGADKGLLVSLGNFSDPSVLLAVAGLVITGFFVARKVKGALLYGILITTVIGIIAGLVDMPSAIISAPPSLAPTVLEFDFSGLFGAGLATIITVVFTLTFVDMFDTIGTLIGVATKSNMLDEEGKLPRGRQALVVDSVGTMFGAALGTSTVTTYVESSAGVAEGGRTGLTAVVTGLLFLVALFFSPIVNIIPSAATAPALIIVGLFMMSPVTKINFEDYTESIPAFLTIVMMPFTWSIAEGLVFGILAYVILKVLTGQINKVSGAMWVLAALFIARFFFM
jgi:AGZA family xanthine/uracil permease-like MFS transporter